MAQKYLFRSHATRWCCWLLLYYCAMVVIIENMLFAFQYDSIKTDISDIGRHRNTAKFINVSSSQETGRSNVTTLGNVSLKPKEPVQFKHVNIPMPNKADPVNVQMPNKAEPKQNKLNHTELEEEYYSKRSTKISRYNHTFIIDERSLCASGTFLVILVHSAPKNTAKRQAIRDTWGRLAKGGSWPYGNVNKTICLGFVLGVPKDSPSGRKVTEESKKHRDIIQGDFIDDYKNMTLKSLLDLRWVDQFSPSAKYFLKSDDDMVINLPHLLDILHTKPLSRSIMGPLCVGSRVYRKGRWGVAKEVFPFALYPPYEAGSAYIITTDIVRELFETAEYVPQFHVDDVYITGILGRILKVTHQRVPGFAFETTKPPKSCDIVKNRVVTGHRMKPDMLVAMWRELQHWTTCMKPPKRTNSTKTN